MIATRKRGCVYGRLDPHMLANPSDDSSAISEGMALLEIRCILREIGLGPLNLGIKQKAQPSSH